MAKRCYFEYSIGKVQCSNYTHKKFSIFLLFHIILLWIASCNVWIWNLQQTVCERLGTCCGNLWSEIRYRIWCREPDEFSKVPTRCPLTHLHFGIFAKDEHFLICIQQDPEKILKWWIHVIFTDFGSQKLQIEHFFRHVWQKLRLHLVYKNAENFSTKALAIIVVLFTIW